MKFNINDKATVRLTEAGKRILRDHHAGLPADLREYFRPRWETDEPVEFPIWDLMHVFGPALYMGAPEMPFVRNEVEMENRK